MRGPERKASGPERNAAPLLRFSTADLPPATRVEQWREVVGRTLTGCSPSEMEGGPLHVDFTFAAGEAARLAVTRLRHVRNHRDGDCLRDGDDDLIFFLQLGGEGLLDHRGERCRLRRGDGMLARFDRTLDTWWTQADLLLIRLPGDALRGVDPDPMLGRPRPASSTLMRLLCSYAHTAWREAERTGTLPPIADRHIAELVGALCAPSVDEAMHRARPAVGPARVAAMREVMARRSGDPCLSMRDVARAVGISERAGHLHFEKANLSFTDELHRTRLDRAREQLLGGDASVTEIAFAVGFSDTSHFHRLFKRRFGCSPGEARRSA